MMTKKTKVKVFDDLKPALQDALAFENGSATDLRVTELTRRPLKRR